MSYRRGILAVIFILLSSSSALAGQTARSEALGNLLRQAASDFQGGRVTEAEETVRRALQQSPHSAAALGLLAVILDAQQRYDEAESAYRQALTLAPGSPTLLYNLGGHYLAQGKPEQARAAFLKVVSADPGHPDANLQLAKLSVDARQGAAALTYLDHLPPQVQGSAPVAILRAQALKLTHQDAAAESLLAKVESNAGSDPRVAFSIGMIFAGWRCYGDAENAFTRALNADPTNFDILYNLGLAAHHAGHLPRAVEVYRIALEQRPNDADCLFNLASILMQTGQADEAIIPLMQAHKAAPERPEILLALAQASQDLGFYVDAATALDQYLNLKPHDDIARRERGFCLLRAGKLGEALDDLRWYAKKHPRDARGLYELAAAETVRGSDKALPLLGQALAIDPKFNAARYVRARRYYQDGRIEESIADVKLVLATEPNNFSSLDVLGQDYMSLKRLPEAAEVLDRALKLAPKNPQILSHYGQVLMRLGRRSEAERVMAEFRGLSKVERGDRPYGGLFDYLNLPPEKQYAKYMRNLQRDITTQPDNPALRVQLGKALLLQGKPDQAIEAFRAARNLSSNPELLATCGKLLSEYEQYAASREFLEPALAANPAGADLRLGLAIAVFHSAGAQEALKVLADTPVQQRKGDYFLLLAQVLDAMNRYEEAVEALNRGFATAPTRADLYFQAALFLIKHQQYEQAIRLLEEANQAIPRTPELQLLQAMTYEMGGEHDKSLRTLAQIESRWPEWALPYMVHGITLAIRLRCREAKPFLENAIALGADTGTANFYLAFVIVNDTPEEVEQAYKAISKALQMTPGDVYVQSLAGQIDFLRTDYPSALNHLNAALRLWPEMLEAHQTLAGVYKAMGNKEKSVAELKESLRIKQENRTAEQAPPFPIDKLLFSVQAPSPVGSKQ